MSAERLRGAFSVAQGNRANDGEQPVSGYELGDLEIVPSRRGSIERPSLTDPANDQQRAPARTGGVPRNLTLADDSLGPALELDVPAAPVRGGIARPQPPAPSVAKPSFGNDSFDDDDDFEQNAFATLPSIDVEPVQRHSNERVVVRESAPVDPKKREAEEAKRVVELAAFGDVPRGIVDCARYAVHVTSRIVKLHRGRNGAVSELRQCVEQYHDALETMGRALLGMASDKRLDGLRGKLARVNDEQSKAHEASSSVERTRDDNQRAVTALDEEAAALNQKLEPYRARERDALVAQRKADEEARRAQAMLKRVEIELRAVMESETQKNPARILALNEQQEQRKGAVDALNAALLRADDELGQARRELALQRGSLDALEERRKQLGSQAAQREAAVQGQKKVADGALAEALRELAEAAREQRLAVLVPEPAALVAQREKPVQEANDTLVRFDRALTLYDRQSVIKGYALMAAILVAGIALLVLR